MQGKVISLFPQGLIICKCTTVFGVSSAVVMTTPEKPLEAAPVLAVR